MTPKQKKFADEWLKDNNGTRAYKVAYPKVKNSETAAVQASTLLRNPNVSAYIRAQQLSLAAENNITQNRILQEEAMLSFSDLRDLFDGESTIPPHELPDNIAKAVSGIEIKTRPIYEGDKYKGEEKTYKYRLWDKGRSLERVSKHLGMYEKDNNQRYGIEQIYNALVSLNPELAGAIKEILSKRADRS